MIDLISEARAAVLEDESRPLLLVSVDPLVTQAHHGVTVALCDSYGKAGEASRLYAHMTPDQAREFAARLVVRAEQVEDAAWRCVLSGVALGIWEQENPS